MNGKTETCAVLALLLSFRVINAADIGYEGALGAYSSYLWRGLRLSDEALQLQPSATLSAGGFSANIWAEYDSDTAEWLEVDCAVSYAHGFDGFNLELGFIHYDVQDGENQRR
ncbi:hypothetical protein JW905_05365 [bacterium]|nr:hypothetical protein [candidate division CSSED10-310 bacterium]